MRRLVAIAVLILAGLPCDVLAQTPPIPGNDRPPSSSSASTANAGVVVGTILTGASVVGGLMVGTSHEDNTAAGVLLAEAGLILGPTIGNGVAGLGGRAGTGFLIRFGVAAGAFAAAWAICGWDCSDASEATVVLVGGAALVTAHAVWDLATMHAAAARHEQRARRVTVGPSWNPATGDVGLNVRIGL